MKSYEEMAKDVLQRIDETITAKKKKKRIIITIISICCILFTGFIATHISLLTGETSHIEPPHMVTFSTETDLHAMLNAPDMSEPAFTEFLNANNYRMNGLYNKSDVSELIDEIKTFGYPSVYNKDSIDGYSMKYYPDAEYLDTYSPYRVIYKINGVTYRFYFDEFTGEKTNRFFMIPLKTCNFEDESVKLYKGSGKWLVGDYYTDTCHITINVGFYDSLDQISLAPFKLTYDPCCFISPCEEHSNTVKE